MKKEIRAHTAKSASVMGGKQSLTHTHKQTNKHQTNRERQKMMSSHLSAGNRPFFQLIPFHLDGEHEREKEKEKGKEKEESEDVE
jgi:hypothetical protein